MIKLRPLRAGGGDRHVVRVLSIYASTRLSLVKDGGDVKSRMKVLTTQSMEPVLLQATFLGDDGVNCIIGDMRCYSPMKRCIKVRNAGGVWNVLQCRFD